jgi:hypothetical protein
MAIDNCSNSFYMCLYPFYFIPSIQESIVALFLIFTCPVENYETKNDVLLATHF